jgi:hypothetical protein
MSRLKKQLSCSKIVLGMHYVFKRNHKKILNFFVIRVRCKMTIVNVFL